MGMHLPSGQSQLVGVVVKGEMDSTALAAQASEPSQLVC
jgi:hypothetical protein